MTHFPLGKAYLRYSSFIHLVLSSNPPGLWLRLSFFFPYLFVERTKWKWGDIKKKSFFSAFMLSLLVCLSSLLLARLKDSNISLTSPLRNAFPFVTRSKPFLPGNQLNHAWSYVLKIFSKCSSKGFHILFNILIPVVYINITVCYCTWWIKLDLISLLYIFYCILLGFFFLFLSFSFLLVVLLFHPFWDRGIVMILGLVFKLH